jgi:hypothetical protein
MSVRRGLWLSVRAKGKSCSEARRGQNQQSRNGEAPASAGIRPNGGAAAAAGPTPDGRRYQGQVASPSRDVLVRLARALDLNPAPFLALAGHFRDARAWIVLSPMFRAGTELPEAWPEDAQVPLVEAIATVSDPRGR